MATAAADGNDHLRKEKLRSLQLAPIFNPGINFRDSVNADIGHFTQTASQKLHFRICNASLGCKNKNLLS